jgi:exodeoxyribonuclease-3
MAAMLKVTTWNVNGVRAREQQLLQWVERERPDVVCLQEIKADLADVPAALCALPGYHCYWHGYRGYSGVALHLSRAAFGGRPRFSHPEFDHEARIVTAQARDVLFASIYVPNGGKDYPGKVRFLDALDAFAERAIAAGQKLVLCGDLNVAREPRDVHPSLRNPAKIGQTPAEQAQLERLIGRGLVDLSRKSRPDDDRLYSWWAPWRNQRERNIGWRLDYVLASRELAEHALSCEVFRDFGSSDHGPVVAVFDVDPPRIEGPGEPEPEPESPKPAPGQLPLF